LFVQVQGMSKPENAPESNLKTMPFFPNFILRDLLLWLIVLNILAVLAVYFPWELGSKADPFVSAPAGIRPEWYFMFMFQTLKFIPGHVLGIEGEMLGILGFGIAGLLWILVPFFDRSTERGRRSKILTYVGIVVVLFIIIMTIIGYILS